VYYLAHGFLGGERVLGFILSNLIRCKVSVVLYVKQWHCLCFSNDFVLMNNFVDMILFTSRFELWFYDDILYYMIEHGILFLLKPCIMLEK
jgi:hypothetical protein